MRGSHAPRRSRDYSVPRTMLALGILLGCCQSAFPLNPSLDISQYAHTAWTVRDGFFKGAIHAIAQTPDGYLWLGTESGLLRFDGVQPTAWEAPQNQPLPSSQIWSLLAARDGTLWIGTAKGLASWKGGRLSVYPEMAGQNIAALLQDHEGAVWAGGFASLASPGSNGKISSVRGAAIPCSGADGILGRGVLSLAESKGNLWVGAASGLWRWRPDKPKVYPIPGPNPAIQALTEGDNGALWIALPGGIRQ